MPSRHSGGQSFFWVWRDSFFVVGLCLLYDWCLYTMKHSEITFLRILVYVSSIFTGVQCFQDPFIRWTICWIAFPSTFLELVYSRAKDISNVFMSNQNSVYNLGKISWTSIIVRSFTNTTFGSNLDTDRREVFNSSLLFIIIHYDSLISLFTFELSSIVSSSVSGGIQFVTCAHFAHEDREII